MTENSDFYLVCTSYYNEDQSPAYIAFNEENIEEYLEEIGLEKGMNFSDVMEVWGDSDVFETSYDDTELDNSDRAMMLYKEFLSGDRNVKGISNIDDITMPKGETDRRYFKKYAYCDANGDTIPELHIKSGKYYFVISYEDNDLFVWKDLSAYNSEYYPLSNGAFLMRKDDVQASPGVSYRYSVFNIKRDEIFGFSFSKANINECTGYDEGDEYLYDGISISQEMWEKLTKRYVYQDNKGNLIIADDLNWITLYEK